MSKSLHIALCDDDPIFLKHITPILEQHLEACNDLDSHTITLFHSPQELLDYKGRCDVYILDIDMPGMNGLQLGEQLNINFNKPLLLFLTSHAQHVLVGYHVRAFRYFLKDDFHNKISCLIHDLIKELYPPTKEIKLDTITGSRFVRSNQILYIQADYKYSNITLQDEQDKVWSTQSFKYWKQTLPHIQFHVSNKSLILNLEHLSNLNGRQATMSNDEVLEIAHKKTKNVLQAKIDYIRWMGRQ